MGVYVVHDEDIVIQRLDVVVENVLETCGGKGLQTDDLEIDGEPDNASVGHQFFGDFDRFIQSDGIGSVRTVEVLEERRDSFIIVI